MALDLLKALEENAMLVWGLAVNQIVKQPHIHDFITKPSPGDLVLEVTTQGDGRHNGRRLGWLLRHGEELVHSDEEWAELVAEGDWASDDPRPTDHFWYIQTPDGEEVRWTNCKFIRVIVNNHERHWAEEGKMAFRTAARCPDCGGTTERTDWGQEWVQFDAETGACRACKGQVNRT